MDIRMHTVGLALEELLVKAQRQNCLVVGLYESAQVLTADPDCAVLCLLAADDEDDVALQIHFTLLQAFFHENDFTILRVWGLNRLQQLLGAATDDNQNTNTQQDFHCILVTNPEAEHCGLEEVESYYQEQRLLNQWVPELVLYDTQKTTESFHNPDGQDQQLHVQNRPAVNMSGVC